MTVYKDGEKFACRQCIQGHRVSTCHHEERPLIHVARKGRPVSQCMHCRGLRKSRQTHIKCDCSERRHSRTTSSESATLTGSDENPCQCGSGKKCTCALKKEPGLEDFVPTVHIDPLIDPVTGRPNMLQRRSESMAPRLRNHYQPALQRSSMSPQDSRYPYQSPRDSGLGRSFHAAQRSVDSLPLLNNATNTSSGIGFPPTAFDNHRYLDPNRTYSVGSPLRNQHTMASFGDFSVSPLGREVTQRTLSPHHPKRHSMNDFGNLLSQFQDENITLPNPSFEGYNSTTTQHKPAEFPFPHVLQDQWQSGWNDANFQRPPLQTTTSLQEFTFPPHPELSRSSSPGVMSEAGESNFHHDHLPSYSGTQPTINIDTSWSIDTYDDKSNYSYTPASYIDTPSDFHYNGDVLLPHYSNESAGTSGDCFDFSDSNDFDVAPVHSRQNSMIEMQHPHPLVDRSITHWSNASEPMLNTAFKFPNNDPTFSEPFSESTDEFDWQYGGGHNFVKAEADSPLTRSS